eukprot:4774370-Amphidinium_carterae.1
MNQAQHNLSLSSVMVVFLTLILQSFASILCASWPDGSISAGTTRKSVWMFVRLLAPSEDFISGRGRAVLPMWSRLHDPGTIKTLAQ